MGARAAQARRGSGRRRRRRRCCTRWRRPKPAWSSCKASPTTKTSSRTRAVRCRFRDAGHILGSAIVEVWVDEAGAHAEAGVLRRPGPARAADRARPDADRVEPTCCWSSPPTATACTARCSETDRRTRVGHRRTRCGAARATSSSRPSRSAARRSCCTCWPTCAAQGRLPRAAGLRRFADGRQGDDDHLEATTSSSTTRRARCCRCGVAPRVAGPALHDAASRNRWR